jgi:arylmalonate decarboxylase
VTGTAAGPTVGLVVPPAAGKVPDDAEILYPSGVRFVAAGLGLEDMTPADYERALLGLEGAVDRVVDDGAEVVSLMGTSLSFYLGVEGHRELLDRLRAAAGGRPVSTMALAVVRALRHVGASRVCVLSAYTGTVADALTRFLDEMGIEVVAAARLDITAIDRLVDVGTRTLVERGTRLLEDAPDADALLLSCGGLSTLGAIAEIEQRRQLPVVSSSQAGLWDVVRLTGEAPRADRPYRLFLAGR